MFSLEPQLVSSTDDNDAVTAMSTVAAQSNGFVTMQRPQIGIDRLPVRRASNEPKEAMNCKSCRKRKVCRAIVAE